MRPAAHGDNAHEIELMSAWGMGPVRALQAATSIAAEVLRKEGELGSVREGSRADLLILEANPHEDITALRRIRTVFRNGVMIRRDR